MDLPVEVSASLVINLLRKKYRVQCVQEGHVNTLGSVCVGFFLWGVFVLDCGFCFKKNFKVPFVCYR